jgi:hypothetical protein
MSTPKSYMNPSEKHLNIDEIQEKINIDEKKYGSAARFGYFSIPYSAFTGDRYYSQGRKKTYRDAEGKVVTEKKGIYTRPAKKGNYSDAYFSNFMAQDKEMSLKLKDMSIKERDEYLALVKTRKDIKGDKNFKPGGPQEYVDYFDLKENKVKYTKPITKEPDRKIKIDTVKHTVITERKGIYTSPAKHGNSTTPGILFSFPKTDKTLIELQKKQATSPRSKSAEKTTAKPLHDGPFKPAALKKNDCFNPDGKVYGETPGKVLEMVHEAVEVRIIN